MKGHAIDVHTFGVDGIYVSLATVLNATASFAEVRKVSRYIFGLRVKMYSLFYDKPKDATHGFLYDLMFTHIKTTSAKLNIRDDLRSYVTNAAIASLRDIALRDRIPERMKNKDEHITLPTLMRGSCPISSPVMSRAQLLLHPAVSYYTVAMDLSKPYNENVAYFWEFKKHNGVYSWSDDSIKFSTKNM